LPVVETALTSLGITVDARNVPLWDGSNTILADKDYDLLMWAQNTLPAGDPQWFLNAFFRSDGANNHAGLSSSAIDRQLDDLAGTESHTERVTTALAAHNAILAEVPVSNLMTPSWHVGLSARLSSYDPWGSDYYVVRADTEPNTPSPAPTCSPTPSPVSTATNVDASPTPSPTPSPVSAEQNTDAAGGSCCWLSLLLSVLAAVASVITEKV